MADRGERKATAGGLWVSVLAVAAVLSLVLAPQASAQQRVGVNLNNYVANAPFDCTLKASTLFGLTPSGATSCTYFGGSIPGQSTATPYVRGVATQVRVKAGAPTGPMQITVVRQLGTPQVGYACCFYAGESQVFTPRANATTTVNVRLPMENTVDAVNEVVTLDYLALTVLQPGVQVPVQWPSNNQFELSSAYFPRMSVNEPPGGRGIGYTTEAVPLLNADIFPLCGAGAAAATADDEPGDSPLEPPARAAASPCLGGVSPSAGALGRSSVRVPLACNIAGLCRGRLSLLRATRNRRSLRASSSKKLGKSKFKIDGGGTKRVKVKLTKAGKRAVRGKRKLKVRFKATVKGAPNASGKLKLKR